ncbi:MAG: hypothetical protein KIH69_013535 [Anaerolineae bacterium]|nr:hypothetical protein [Anaerolineae bacterium]
MLTVGAGVLVAGVVGAAATGVICGGTADVGAIVAGDVGEAIGCATHPTSSRLAKQAA